MRIVKATCADYVWKRERPITNGLHTYDVEDVSFVRIETEDGIVGYGVGRPRPGERDFRRHFLESLVGRDALMTEAIWASLWSPKMSGRRGYETRALSSIDLALWDIRAKAAKLPLYKILGGFRTEIPFYIAGGYYVEGKGLQDLQDELLGFVRLGARAVKMKVGALPIEQDAARVAAAREAIGPDIGLLLDANCAYRAHDAIRFIKRVEACEPYWFEEAVQPDDYDGFRRIAQATSVPLATGENEYTKYGFRDLIGTGAISIINPDVRYMGGVTEFMKVAALAQTHGLEIAPHGDQQAHLHVLAAIPNARLLEYYPPEINRIAASAYRHPPRITQDGRVVVPDVVGAGLDPDQDAIEQYRIA